MSKGRTRNRVLPGFGVTMGCTLTYLSLMVLIPLAGLFIMSARLSWADFLHKAVLDPRVLASYRLSFGTAFIAALINALFGFIVAWVLVRYQFWGKRIVDALVDLPFACRPRFQALPSPRCMLLPAGLANCLPLWAFRLPIQPAASLLP